jgi:hypothetical protein
MNRIIVYRTFLASNNLSTTSLSCRTLYAHVVGHCIRHYVVGLHAHMVVHCVNHYVVEHCTPT